MGRGPVCGIITRRAGGAGGVAGAATVASGSVSTAAGAAGASAAGTEGAASAAGLVGAGGFGAAASVAGVGEGTGLVAGEETTTLGVAAVTGCSAVGGATAVGAAATGGRAMTGPTGGLLAIAGAGATMFAPWRGRGTMRRGAGCVAAGCVAEEPGGAEGGADTTRGGTAATVAEAGGGATTAVARGGGAAFAVASACFRSRMALSASPGLETLERSNLGLLSACCCRFALPLLPPFLKYSRTFSA
jgi:hypothetical protein